MAERFTIALAYPGDLATPTGGYGYDRRVVAAWQADGVAVRLVALSAGFPDPSAADLGDARAKLAAVPADTALVIDGLALGAMPADLLGGIAAPITALIHHPLALETGLDATRAAALRASETVALTFARTVIATSAHTASILASDYGVDRNRITVAEPGLDAAWHRVPRAPQSPPLLVSLGSLTPRKGHDSLIRALARLTDRPWTAVIIGSLDRSPETTRALRQSIADFGLEERVTLAGEWSDDAIREGYARATAFVLASRYEGYGMVFAEAMAAGLPVVGCRAGAVPDVVPEAASILVPPGDDQALAEAMATLLDQPARAAAMGLAARQAAARFPDWPTTAARILASVQEGVSS